MMFVTKKKIINKENVSLVHMFYAFMLLNCKEFVHTTQVKH